MACVADKVYAAPFAIVGSIGVVGQMPNFHKWLKKHHIDYEMQTAGEYKRTLTVFGENNDKARAKFQQELQETHDLFKQFITDNRSQVNLDEVATGEHWYGSQALSKQLVDYLITSDDYLLNQSKTADLYLVKQVSKKRLSEKLANTASMTINKCLWSWWQEAKENQVH